MISDLEWYRLFYKSLVLINCSEFSDIFDVELFKRILQADVRIVSSLPSTHLMSRQSIEHQIPNDVSPFWIRTKFSRKVLFPSFILFKILKSAVLSWDDHFYYIPINDFMQLNEEGLLVLKGLASKLSKNLPPDLQKLRCKVRQSSHQKKNQQGISQKKKKKKVILPFLVRPVHFLGSLPCAQICRPNSGTRESACKEDVD